MTIEYRQVGEATVAGGNLSGLVTPFNVNTEIGSRSKGGFTERVAPGAFKKTLSERDVVLVHNHNTDLPLARTGIPSGSTGHLSLTETPQGLRMQATPVQTSAGKDVLALASAGVIRGMSFGFEVVKDAWTDDEGRSSDSVNGTMRTIQEVKLHEVTTTAFPAYETSELTARSIQFARRDSGPQGEDHGSEKYNTSDRKAAAKSGAAMPDGSFPIKDAEDLQNAIHLAGNAKNPAAARKHIMARADALGLKSSIPSTWNADGTLSRNWGAMLETRDVADGDDPNAAFYRVWAEGARPNLENIDRTQLPPGVQEALTAIDAWFDQYGVSVPESDSESVSESDAPAGTDRSAVDAEWVLRARNEALRLKALLAYDDLG